MFLLRSCIRNCGGSSSSTARIISTHATPRLLSPSASASLTPRTTSASLLPPVPLCAPLRPFSSSGKGGDGKDGKDSDRSFFLADEESFPAPPTYVRDAVTGKWTGETRARPSSKDRRLLNLDDDAKGEEVMSRLEGRWERASAEAKAAGGDEDGAPNAEHERVARRIQEQRLALGPIGRDPADGAGGTGGDADAMEKPLTPREFQALKAYAQHERGANPGEFARLSDDDPDLIPHNSVASGGEGSTDAGRFFDADLDMAYLNPRLQRRAFREEGAGGDDPFADLLPSDLNPARKVNRRNAKPIPKRLLHHNNLSLLRRYTTPGGKIMNRVQSRLGAKDQRKISKLVKRARHLGLIPYLGQWKFEDHGYLHEEGFSNANDAANQGEEAEGKRDWEVELEKRGLWPLADETEIAKRFYDMDKMMDNLAGPRGGKKRDKLEELLGGVGALVPGKKTKEDGEVDG